jgi:HSP20 family protein
MTTLMPRWFGELTDWFETERPQAFGHVIRVEDSLTDQEYTIRAELPGMDPDKDIQVSVDNGALSIHAERRVEQKGHGRSEFRYGMLHRSVRLPGNADADNIKATYNKGILEVAVPLRASEPTGRQVMITSK